MKKLDLRVGFCFSGSYCTFEKAIGALQAAADRYTTVIPILSEHVTATNSRFGTSRDFRERMETICGQAALTAIPEVEPIGPKKLLDVLIIAPCTGNTLAKLAHGITDTTVTMAAKAHLRNGRPVVVAPSTNDGLSVSLCNIGELLCRKGIYFVPFGQDDCVLKPNSLVADFKQINQTVEAALDGVQLQPVLI